MYVGMCMLHCTWQEVRGQLLVTVSFLPPCDLGDWSQVVRLGSKNPYLLRSLSLAP